jgi:hypothetical protein
VLLLLKVKVKVNLSLKLPGCVLLIIKMLLYYPINKDVQV